MADVLKRWIVQGCLGIRLGNENFIVSCSEVRGVELGSDVTLFNLIREQNEYFISQIQYGQSFS